MAYKKQKFIYKLVLGGDVQNQGARFWGVSSLGLLTANFSFYLHKAESSKLVLWPVLIRALIPFMRAPPSWPNYLLKASLPNTITLGLDFNI